MNRRRTLPHLNVRSNSLVYLSEVPPNISGREIKRLVINQFGLIRFVETFEAWNGIGILTGDMIIEFDDHKDSKRFITGVINGDVPFLKAVGVQHVEIVGPRHFFQLIHRNTGHDLLYSDGKPLSMDWARARSRSRQSRARGRSHSRSRQWRSRSRSQIIPIGVESTWQNRQRNRIRNRDLFWAPSLMQTQNRWNSRSRSRSRSKQTRWNSRSRSRHHTADTDTNTSIFSRVTWPYGHRNQQQQFARAEIHLIDNNKSGTSSIIISDDDDGTSGSGPSCFSSTITRDPVPRSRHPSKRTIATNDLEEGEIVDSDSHEEEGADPMSLEGAGDPMDLEGNEEEEEGEIDDDIELLSGGEEDDGQSAAQPIATGQTNENANEDIDDIISGESVVDDALLNDDLIDDQPDRDNATTSSRILAAILGNGNMNHEQENDQDDDDDDIIYLGPLCKHIRHLSIDKSFGSSSGLNGVPIKQEPDIEKPTQNGTATNCI